MFNSNLSDCEIRPYCKGAALGSSSGWLKRLTEVWIFHFRRAQQVLLGASRVFFERSQSPTCAWLTLSLAAEHRALPRWAGCRCDRSSSSQERILRLFGRLFAGTSPTYGTATSPVLSSTVVRTCGPSALAQKAEPGGRAGARQSGLHGLFHESGPNKTRTSPSLRFALTRARGLRRALAVHRRRDSGADKAARKPWAHHQTMFQ